MHEIIDSPDQNVFGVKLEDALTQDDYDVLVPFLKDRMRRFTTARFCFEMDGVNAWEPEDAWDDLAFDLRHTRDVDRVAVVGDDAWETWTQKLHVLFPEATIGLYTDEEKEDAWEWLRGDMDVPGIGPGSVSDPTAGAQDEASVEDDEGEDGGDEDEEDETDE